MEYELGVSGGVSGGVGIINSIGRPYETQNLLARSSSLFFKVSFCFLFCILETIMSDYLNFAKQLGLTNVKEQSILFDIVSHLYGKFDNLNLGMSYEEFLTENYLNDIISKETPIDDLLAFNDFVEAIGAEQTQRKQEEKQALFVEFEQEGNEFIYNFPFKE